MPENARGGVAEGVGGRGAQRGKKLPQAEIRAAQTETQQRAAYENEGEERPTGFTLPRRTGSRKESHSFLPSERWVFGGKVRRPARCSAPPARRHNQLK